MSRKKRTVPVFFDRELKGTAPEKKPVV